jgi:2-polyprenyl-3-methyl-5-hydroxy-6-metoxy-1,4-benzoquinol methylase
MGTFHGRALVECAACGLRSYFPTPTDDELKALYATQAYTSADYFAVEESRETNHARQMRQAASLLANRLQGRGRVLEIGPGKGLFLDLCRGHGLDIDALELSEPLARELRQRTGLTVLETPLESSDIAPGSYAAIAAFDLFEHVQDPMGWLRAAWRALAPGGTLLFSTVSVQNLLDQLGRLFLRLGLPQPMAKLHPPYHLYYFRPALIRRYLEATDFRLESMVEENYDVKKASSRLTEQLFLRGVYAVHDLCGHKTNLYVTCAKP